MKRAISFTLLAVLGVPIAAIAKTYPGWAWHELSPASVGPQRQPYLKLKVFVDVRQEPELGEVQVQIKRYRMERCRGTFPSFRVCTGKPLEAPETLPCKEPVQPARYRCEASKSFSESALQQPFLVEYAAFHRRPKEASWEPLAEPIQFGVGHPPRRGVFETAVPLRYHVERPIGAMKNLGLLPSPEYLLQGRERGYLDYLSKSTGLVASTFFGGAEDRFSRVFHDAERDVNVWSGGFGADVARPNQPNFLCDFAVPSRFVLVQAAMDALVLVHEWDGAKECSRIHLADRWYALNAKGTLHVTREPLPPWVLVHEAGHFLFGQSDEYCCDGGYAPELPFANVFLSSSCVSHCCPERDVLRFKVAPEDYLFRCLDGIGGAKEIMETRRSAAELRTTDWGRSTYRAIRRVFHRLRSQRKVLSALGSDPNAGVPGTILRIRVSRAIAPSSPVPGEGCRRRDNSEVVDCTCVGSNVRRGVEVEPLATSTGNSGLQIVKRRVGEKIVIDSQVYAQEGGGLLRPGEEVTILELPQAVKDRSSLMTLEIRDSLDLRDVTCTISIESLFNSLFK